MGASGSGAGGKGNLTVVVPETSEVLGDIPNGSLVRLVFQNVKWDVLVVLIATCLCEE